MPTENCPIGIMDSGVGGLSVMNALRFLMPYENYVYLADDSHAPYGEKPTGAVLEYVLKNADVLMNYSCKCIVMACNTATAVAVERVRERYRGIPVVGLEPAVRPAIKNAVKSGGAVLVLTTELTLKQERFCKLCRDTCREYGAEIVEQAVGNDNGARGVYLIAAQRLVKLAEESHGDGEEATEYLRSLTEAYQGIGFKSVVLGCTHFPFAKNAITAALGYPVEFFDGGEGAARRAKTLLEKAGTLTDRRESGWVRWLCSEKGYVKTLRRMNSEIFKAVRQHT